MGYYTNYELELSDNSQLKNVVEVLKGMDIIDYALDYNLDSYDGVKWYGYKEDMKTLAKTFPDILFTLYGTGEEPEDIWKCYFQGDKVHYMKATFVYENDPHGFE